MSDVERELAAEVARLSEQLAEYRSVVGAAVKLLGHEGNEPSDLIDALGQVEALLAGTDTNERNDLTGLAELVRQALWNHGRARALLADSRSVCERRTVERDQAERERDAAARELARVLAEREADQQPDKSALTIDQCAVEMERLNPGWSIRVIDGRLHAEPPPSCDSKIIIHGADD